MGLLKVTGVVVSCNLLVCVQLGQVGRFGRLMYKAHEVVHVMPSSARLCSPACTRDCDRSINKGSDASFQHLPSTVFQ